MTQRPRARVPKVVLRDGDHELLHVLREAQLLVVKYPTAAQAAFRAFAAEGRRFATTPEGRRWKARLAGSELVRRGHMLWSGSALDMLEEGDDRILPSGFLDAVLAAVTRPDLPELLLRMLGDDHDAAADHTSAR